MPSLKFEDGYKAVMKELGFIVICWKFEIDKAAFEKGDRVTRIWGGYIPPEPLVVLGRSGRKQFARQMKILLDHGYPPSGAKVPPAGWKLTKVGRLAEAK